MSDIHALSGAYAVDALDDGERDQFEEHLLSEHYRLGAGLAGHGGRDRGRGACGGGPAARVFGPGLIAEDLPEMLPPALRELAGDASARSKKT